MSDRLTVELAGIVGAGHVLVDPAARAGYEHDWTGRWHGEAAAVIRPADVEEVSAVLVACRAQGVAVVTQGGNTGLVGGGVPRADAPGGRSQVVLSTARLDRVGDVDPATAQLCAGAGVTLAAAQRAAAAHGLDLPLDLAARDSATLGGLVACDAGGLRALRHGTARRQLAGVEAVLADGAVVRNRMNGVVKDTAGYDLGALLVGSEGTLGVITAVRWSLAPRRDARAIALVSLDTVQEAVALARALAPQLESLEICELMLRAGIALTLAHLGREVPEDLAPVAVLVGCAAREDPLDELAAALEATGLAQRAVSPADAAGRDRLLAVRERHADAISAAGVPLKLDVGVPLDRLAEFVARAGPAIKERAPGAWTVIFGHLLDGNLHVNVLYAGTDAADALEADVLSLAAQCGGTVSAEHGIGVHKTARLSLTRSEAEIAAMRAIKRALDPDGVLNPGVGLPAGAG